MQLRYNPISSRIAGDAKCVLDILKIRSLPHQHEGELFSTIPGDTEELSPFSKQDKIFLEDKYSEEVMVTEPNRRDGGRAHYFHEQKIKNPSR